MEHVVDAIEMPGLFDRGDVGWLFHHADQFLISGRIAAIDAGIDVRNVVADRAQAQLSFYVSDGGGEGFGIVLAGAQNVESQTLCALAADSGQLLEFVDEPGHRFGKLRHAF